MTKVETSTDQYKLTDIRTLFSLKSLWRGQRAIKAIAVVQLGFAINLDVFVHSPLISGITNGISLSYRNADCTKKKKRKKESKSNHIQCFVQITL